MRWYPENSSDFINLELSCLKELCLFRGDGDGRIFHAFFQHGDFAAVLGASELRLPCLPDTLRIFDGSGVFQYTGRGCAIGEELSSIFLSGDGKADGVFGHCNRTVPDKAIKAGANAWKYVQGELPEPGRMVPVNMGFGVGGIVPQYVSDKAEGTVNFMFRPRNVYRNARVIVEIDGTPVLNKKTMILAPGEMVNLDIPVEKLVGLDKAEAINVRIEVPEA